MTPEAQRIVIAETCGWKNVKPVIVRNVTKQGDDRFCGITSDDGWVPDYLNDLNAMHEAEKTLKLSEQKNFCFHLFSLLGFPDAQSDWDDLWYVQAICATSAQRAEAFLRTKGLWKD